MNMEHIFFFANKLAKSEANWLHFVAGFKTSQQTQRYKCSISATD